MIYTVTLNPSVDYIAGVECIKEGFVNRTNYESMVPGGKGINVSVVIKNLGMESCALGFVGGFTGEYIKNDLENQGIRTDFTHLESGISRINVKLKSEKETEINGAGPEISEREKKDFLEKVSGIKEGDILVLAGSVPKSLGKEFYSAIMKNLSEKKVKIAVDCEGEALTSTLQYKPFLIKPNNFELEGIFEREIESKENLEECARELQKMGAQNVFVSMGKDGGLLVCQDGNTYFSPSPKGKLVNSTGSGDSVVAGFIWEYEKSGSFENAFLMGLACGSATAFSEGFATAESAAELYNELKNYRCEGKYAD